MAPPPRSVALLIDKLSQKPLPTDLDITILDVDSSAAYPDRAFAKVETHFGIHAPDLPRLAREFREEYALLRQRRRHRSTGAVETSLRVLDTTTCLLLVCPDHSTAWADRRQALLLGSHGATPGEGALHKELDFCNMLFTQHSKA